MNLLGLLLSNAPTFLELFHAGVITFTQLRDLLRARGASEEDLATLQTELDVRIAARKAEIASGNFGGR